MWKPALFGRPGGESLAASSHIINRPIYFWPRFASASHTTCWLYVRGGAISDKIARFPRPPSPHTHNNLDCCGPALFPPAISYLGFWPLALEYGWRRSLRPERHSRPPGVEHPASCVGGGRYVAPVVKRLAPLPHFLSFPGFQNAPLVSFRSQC